MDEPTVRRLLAAERDRLQATRDHLVEHGLDAGEDGALAPEDRYEADGASDVLEREVDLSLLAQLDDELRAVDEATARLENGTYGCCDRCEEPIPAARLEAVPATTRCVRHAEALERPLQPVPAGRPGEDAAEVARREAQHHFDLIPDDDLLQPDGTLAVADTDVSPEELGIHVDRRKW